MLPGSTVVTVDPGSFHYPHLDLFLTTPHIPANPRSGPIPPALAVEGPIVTCESL